MRLTSLFGIALLAAGLPAAGQGDPWQREGAQGGQWVADATVTPDAQGGITFVRGSTFHARLAGTLAGDLDATPCLQLDAPRSTTPWRLTAQLPGGPEIVLADRQVSGTCRRSLSQRLGARGRTQITLRLYAWGWGSGDAQTVAFTPRLVAAGPDADADLLQGAMAEGDARARRQGEAIRPLVAGHPRLRFSAANRAEWQTRARTDLAAYAEPLAGILADLPARKAEPAFVLAGEEWKTRRPAWGQHLLAIRPPAPPALAPGEGRDPFGGSTENTWRELCWHDYSLWLIGAALSDDPVFVEQAKRWTLEPIRWRFWLHPEFRYFDFECAYPLQCLAFGYDVAALTMTETERREVRDAMGQMAQGLYLNTLSGHGSIYNDPRGNHTGVAMCGLGLAGLALLGEDPRAPRWVALAERFLGEMFQAHPTGAWLETPSYGAYGACEWMKLTEALRNVAGRDRTRDPFWQRFAEFQLHLADWDGRDLGYNQGGAGEYWNQWVFHAIARAFQDSRFQWLAHPPGDAAPRASGYGDLFWWADPSLQPRRPTEHDTGRTFEDIGVSVWRSGWDEKATLLLLHCGAKGQHKEDGMNQVTLYALGQRLLPDGIGTRTEDHNVPVVDGRPQNKYYPGETRLYHCDARSGYALGDYSRAYSGFRRHVLFLRPDLVALVDDLDVGEKGEHTVRFLLHPNGEAREEGGVVTVAAGDATLQACTALPNGDLLPVALQALPPRRRATHVSAATWTGKGRVRAVTFLAISPRAELGALRVSAFAGGLELQAGARRYRLGLQPGEVAPGFRADAPLWLARLGDGGPERILAAVTDDEARATLTTPAGAVGGSPAVSWGQE